MKLMVDVRVFTVAPGGERARDGRTVVCERKLCRGSTFPICYACWSDIVCGPVPATVDCNAKILNVML